MKNRSRRNFLISGVALLTVLGLGHQSGLISKGFSSLFGNTVSLEQYEHLKKQIRSLDILVDEENSFFIPDSESLVVYLPDIHNEDYAKKQRKRVSTLDSAIEFDVIGLEGLEGQIDTQYMDMLKSFIDRFAKKELISCEKAVFRAHYEVDQDERLSEIQKLAVSGKKLRIQFADYVIENEFLQENIYRNPNKKISETVRELSVDILGEMGRLPACDSTIRNAFFEYLLAEATERKKYHPSIPALHFYDLPTNARMVGFEDMDLYEFTGAARDIAIVDINLHKAYDMFNEAEQKISTFRDLYAQHDSAESAKNWEKFDCTLNEFLVSYNKKAKEMIEFRNRRMQLLSPDEAGNWPDPIKDPEGAAAYAMDLIDRTAIKRSFEWIKNAKNHHMSILVGGVDHLDSVVEACKNYDVNLISLDCLDKDYKRG